ncbi:MAG: hypothetical protein IPO20_22845 [Gammaproteobacteria bacterium]|nr:hypothetical protein [Gammaproteobacteria bacterium]
MRDDVKLTLGLRYTVDEKDIDDVQYLYNSFVPLLVSTARSPARAGQPLGRVDNENGRRPRVALCWTGARK